MGKTDRMYICGGSSSSGSTGSFDVFHSEFEGGRIQVSVCLCKVYNMFICS